MELTLESVRLRNFRAHRDYTFEPGDTGITAVVGRNGRGKSTIIDGMAWALFGTTPNSSIKNGTWRNDRSDPDDECFVDLRMRLNGQELRVKRSLVNARGSVECECWLDGNEQAGPAVTHAQRWITKTLGMDEQGFLSSVLVQQKKVDELATATPSTRKRILEKLTGISAVSKALDLAKQNERALRKAAEFVDVDDSRVPSLEKQRDGLVADADATARKLEDLTAKRKALLAEGRRLSDETKAMQALATENARLQSGLEAAERQTAESKSRMDSLVSRREELKKELPDSPMSADEADGLAARLRDSEDQVGGLKADLAALERVIAAAPGDADEKAAAEAAGKADETLAGMRPEDGIRADADDQRARAAAAKADIAAVDEAHERLDGATDGTGASITCPTCMQEVNDPRHVLDELTERGEAARRTVDEATAELKRLRAELDARRGAETAAGKARDTLDAIRRDREAARDAGKQAEDLRARVRTAEAETEALRAAANKLGAEKAKLAEYDRVLDDYNDETRRWNAAERQRKDLTAKLKENEKRYSPSKLDRLNRNLDAKHEEFNECDRTCAELRGDEQLKREQARSTDAQIASIRENVEKRRNLLDQLEVAAGVTVALSEYREHRILDAIPQMTDYASDLMDRITNGAFTTIDISDKFGITVTTSDGEERSVGELSGGEQSLVALCLRLSVSVMLGNGTLSLLVLDESLPSMDEERTVSFLECIKDLGENGQVVIVTHDDIVRSIADHVVDLNSDDAQPASGDNGTDE